VTKTISRIRSALDLGSDSLSNMLYIRRRRRRRRRKR